MIIKKTILILYLGLLMHVGMIQSALSSTVALVSGATVKTATSLLLLIRTPNSELIKKAKDFDVKCVEFNQQVQAFLKEQEIELETHSALLMDQSDLSSKGEQITKMMDARSRYPWNAKYIDNFQLYVQDMEKCCAHLQNNREQLELKEELSFFYYWFHDFKTFDFNCNDNPDAVQNIAKNIMGKSVKYPLQECLTKVNKTVSLWDKQHKHMPSYDPVYIAWLKEFQEKMQKSYVFRLEQQLFELDKRISALEFLSKKQINNQGLILGLAIFAAIKPH